MKKILKNFLSIGCASVLSQLISFLCVSYYAKVLGVTVFGEITLAQQIILYFTTFTMFGIQTYATRYLVKNKDKVNETAGKIIMFRFIIAALSFVMVCLISPLLKKGAEFSTILILFGTTLFPIALNIDWLFNAFEDMKHNGIFTIFKNILPAIIIFLCINKNKDYSIIPIATFIGGALGFIYQFIVAKVKYKVKFIFKLNFKDIKYLCMIGMPFLLSSMLSMINNNADKIILGVTGHDYALGIYQSAYVFISFIISLIGLLFTAIFPSMSLLYYNKEKDKLNTLCYITTKIVSVISVPLCIGGILLSKDIINLFYGSKYEEAYKPFIILMVYILIIFIREIYGYELNAWGMEKKYLKIVAVSSILNLILNIILTPRYGYMCAAIITLLTELINFISMRKCARTVEKVKDYKEVMKAFPASIIMGIFILILKFFDINVLIIILIGTLVYVMLTLLFKVITVSEIKKLME